MGRRATKHRRMSHRKKSHRRHRGGYDGETAPALTTEEMMAQDALNNEMMGPEPTSEETSSSSSSESAIGLNAMGMGMGGRKRRHGKKSKRGGSTMAQGAWPWVSANFGSSTEQQFMNTFGNGGPGNAGALIPTVPGAPAVLPYNQPQGSLALNNGPPAGSQQGGKRRHRGSRSKKGGYWAQVIEQALVPFGLLGLQNAYAKRTRKHHNK